MLAKKTGPGTCGTFAGVVGWTYLAGLVGCAAWPGSCSQEKFHDPARMYIHKNIHIRIRIHKHAHIHMHIHIHVHIHIHIERYSREWFCRVTKHAGVRGPTHKSLMGCPVGWPGSPSSMLEHDAGQVIDLASNAGQRQE